MEKLANKAFNYTPLNQPIQSVDMNKESSYLHLQKHYIYYSFNAKKHVFTISHVKRLSDWKKVIHGSDVSTYILRSFMVLL